MTKPDTTGEPELVPWSIIGTLREMFQAMDAWNKADLVEKRRLDEKGVACIKRLRTLVEGFARGHGPGRPFEACLLWHAGSFALAKDRDAIAATLATLRADLDRVAAEHGV